MQKADSGFKVRMPLGYSSYVGLAKDTLRRNLLLFSHKSTWSVYKVSAVRHSRNNGKSFAGTVLRGMQMYSGF